MLNLEDDTFGAAGIQSGKGAQATLDTGTGSFRHWLDSFLGPFGTPFESGDLAFFAPTR